MKRYRLLLSLISIVSISICPTCRSNKEIKNANPLYGSWVRQSKIRKIALHLQEDKTLRVDFVGEDLSFPGSFKIDGDNIQFTDFYCGWKFPGIYSFNIKNDRLHLKIIDDHFCTRNKMFEGEWDRLAN
jgi:hypothetical protein